PLRSSIALAMGSGTYRAFTEKMGIPPFLAKVAMRTEFFAPIWLILGVFTRIAALSVIILLE
ncbi:DoxX family membrane protein, partial [Citrobacter youngae]|uniref:DoxX family membrane protein n=1 Tax=Citrobacter youngae TaxID=133448 RepID=UPI001953D961